MHLLEKRPKLSDLERHDLLEFIYHWLAGSYMEQGPMPRDAAQYWRRLAQLYPPKVGGIKQLYRLVTLPIEHAEKKHFHFRPAMGSVSSWTSTLVGLDAVAGVAQDIAGNKNPDSTVRLAIRAPVPGQDILATPLSIRRAFMEMSHDYFDRFPETYKQTTGRDGQVVWSEEKHPDWPSNDPSFTIHDVDYLRDVLNRPGGHLRQYEHVVVSPPMIDATVVRIYRVGSDVLRYGNDDPHN